MNDNLTMDQLRIGTEHEVGDVQDLALLIIDPDRKGLRAGDYFQKTVHSLLAGCILHLFYKSKVEGSPATFDADRPAHVGQLLLKRALCAENAYLRAHQRR
jgi:type IV secretory pathway TraG/TraD family ATPase VirD4